MLRRPANRPTDAYNEEQEETMSSSSSGWHSYLHYLRYAAFVGVFITVVIVLVIVNQDRAILSNSNQNQNSILEQLETAELEALESGSSSDDQNTEVDINQESSNDDTFAGNVKEINLETVNEPSDFDNTSNPDSDQEINTKTSQYEQDADDDSELIAAIDELIDKAGHGDTIQTTKDLDSNNMDSAALLNSINQTLTVKADLDTEVPTQNMTMIPTSINHQEEIQQEQESGDDIGQANPDSITIRLHRRTAKNAVGILPNPQQIYKLSTNSTQ